MRILVTGHKGYIGTVAVPLFAKSGHELTGLDMIFTSGAPTATGSALRTTSRRSARTSATSSVPTL